MSGGGPTLKAVYARQFPVARAAGDAISADRQQVMALGPQIKSSVDEFMRPITENNFKSFAEGDDPTRQMLRDYRPCVGANCTSDINMPGAGMFWGWVNDATAAANYQLPLNQYENEIIPETTPEGQVVQMRAQAVANNGGRIQYETAGMMSQSFARAPVFKSLV